MKERSNIWSAVWVMATLAGCHVQDGAPLNSEDIPRDLSDVASEMLVVDMNSGGPDDALPDLRDASADLIEEMDTSSPPDMPVEMDLSADMMDMATPPAPRCGTLPDMCPLPSPATPHFIAPLEPCDFALIRHEDTALFADFTSQIAAWRGAPIALADIDLNRHATPQISALNAERLSNHDTFGFAWNDGDEATTDWYPQGITGSSDAHQHDQGSPRRLMVSWYDRDESEHSPRGVRISLVELGASIMYRHILLVEPARRADGTLEMKPLLAPGGGSMHGGGIVWLNHMLYVADTTRGIRVFDLRHIYEVDTSTRTFEFGADAVHAMKYRYVLPQRASYRVDPQRGCAPRFSFIGLDRTQSPPVMSSGEYRKDDEQGRLLFWPVRADDSGWLEELPDGTVRPVSAHTGAQTRMQGALSLHGDIAISSSSQTPNRFGRLYRTRPGMQSRITAWPYGAEDLYHERITGRIWTPAEHPGNRDTVSIPYVPF